MSFGGLERPAGGHRPVSEINVTPLVDVMLVLLVIFIMATPFMASRLALELPKTETTPKAAKAAGFVTIEVDAQGRIHWDGEVLAREALHDRFRQTAQRDPETELQLRADASLSYGQVVQLIGLAQAAGLSRIGFVADAKASPPLRR